MALATSFISFSELDSPISFPMLGENFSINPPSFIQIGSFPVYLYGMIIAFGFLLAFLYGFKFHKRIGIRADDIYDLAVFAVPSAIIGARLYYVLFNWSLYADDLLGILRIRDGGLAIYGGVIGTVIALYFRCKHKKIPLGPPMDIAAFGLLIGQSIGRWGNFVNREAYGYTTEIFCRMGITPPGGETFFVHPTFLYESLWNLLGLVILHFLCKHRRQYQGQFFILYVFWYGLGRLFIEGLRTDSLWLIQDVVRVSQLLAFLSAAAALAVYIINFRRISRGQKPFLGGAPTNPEKEGDA